MDPIITELRAAARRLLAQAYAILPANGKRPWDVGTGAERRGWNTFTITPDSVETEIVAGITGLGVRFGAPSADRVDVDVDSDEALAAAARWLPQTTRIFGRPSKPRSHWEYTASPPPKSFTCTDYPGAPTQTPKSTMLVELRSTGLQSIVPPSLHLESGERIRFDCEGEPSRVAPTDLVDAVRLLGAQALLSRHWPRSPGGTRHYVALALAGFLLPRGLAVPAVQQLVEMAAHYAGDVEWEDRGRAVVCTAINLWNGEKNITGGRRLNELVEGRLITHLVKLLGLPPAAVDGDEPRVHVRDQADSAAPAASAGSGGGPGAEAPPPVVEWEEVRPWPTLDPAALHGLAGDVVRVLEPHTEADPAALLQTFLALFGNAAGDGPHVRVGAIRHPARIFPCLVGKTARSRKGQSFGEISSVFERADAAWWASARAGGLASGEGIIARVRDTDQGIVEKRALFYEPEFARTLAAAGRDGSTLSAVLRDAWDTGQLAVTTRKDPIVATGAHIGVVAHVTLEELRARLTSLEIANGFANRFLFTCVRRSKKLPSGGTLADAERARLGDRVGAALKAARTRTVVTRTPAAEKLWCEIYDQLPDPGGLFGAVTARAEAQLLRLQLEYCLLDLIEQIDVPHLEAAVAVWRYAEASTAFIFGGTLGHDHTDRLLDEVRAVYPMGLSREQQHAFFGRHVTAAELATIRETLVRLGLAEERSEPGAGRHPWMLYALPKAAKEAKEGYSQGYSQGLPSLPSQVPEGKWTAGRPSSPVDAPNDDAPPERAKEAKEAASARGVSVDEIPGRCLDTPRGTLPDTALFEAARAWGFAVLELRQSVVVGPGEDAWRLFSTNGTPDDQAQARQALEALEHSRDARAADPAGAGTARAQARRRATTKTVTSTAQEQPPPPRPPERPLWQRRPPRELDAQDAERWANCCRHVDPAGRAYAQDSEERAKWSHLLEQLDALAAHRRFAGEAAGGDDLACELVNALEADEEED